MDQNYGQPTPSDNNAQTSQKEREPSAAKLKDKISAYNRLYNEREAEKREAAMRVANLESRERGDRARKTSAPVQGVHGPQQQIGVPPGYGNQGQPYAQFQHGALDTHNNLQGNALAPPPTFSRGDGNATAAPVPPPPNFTSNVSGNGPVPPAPNFTGNVSGNGPVPPAPNFANNVSGNNLVPPAPNFTSNVSGNGPVPPPPNFTNNVSGNGPVPPPPNFTSNMGGNSSAPPPPPNFNSKGGSDSSIPPIPPSFTNNVSGSNLVPPVPNFTSNVSGSAPVPPVPNFTNNVSGNNLVPPVPNFANNVSGNNLVPPVPNFTNNVSGNGPVPPPTNFTNNVSGNGPVPPPPNFTNKVNSGMGAKQFPCNAPQNVAMLQQNSSLQRDENDRGMLSQPLEYVSGREELHSSSQHHDSSQITSHHSHGISEQQLRVAQSQLSDVPSYRDSIPSFVMSQGARKANIQHQSGSNVSTIPSDNVLPIPKDYGMYSSNRDQQTRGANPQLYNPDIPMTDPNRSKQNQNAPIMNSSHQVRDSNPPAANLNQQVHNTDIPKFDPSRKVQRTGSSVFNRSQQVQDSVAPALESNQQVHYLDQQCSNDSLHQSSGSSLPSFAQKNDMQIPPEQQQLPAQIPVFQKSVSRQLSDSVPDSSDADKGAAPPPIRQTTTIPLQKQDELSSHSSGIDREFLHNSKSLKPFIQPSDVLPQQENPLSSGTDIQPKIAFPYNSGRLSDSVIAPRTTFKAKLERFKKEYEKEKFIAPYKDRIRALAQREAQKFLQTNSRPSEFNTNSRFRDFLNDRILKSLSNCTITDKDEVLSLAKKSAEEYLDSLILKSERDAAYPYLSNPVNQAGVNKKLADVSSHYFTTEALKEEIAKRNKNNDKVKKKSNYVGLTGQNEEIDGKLVIKNNTDIRYRRKRIERTVHKISYTPRRSSRVKKKMKQVVSYLEGDRRSRSKVSVSKHCLPRIEMLRRPVKTKRYKEEVLKEERVEGVFETGLRYVRLLDTN